LVIDAEFIICDRIVLSLARTVIGSSLELVHQVRDWYSGAAIKMSRRSGGCPCAST